MKISFTILVLYFAIICISITNPKQLKPSQKDHVLVSNLDKINFSTLLTKKERNLGCPNGPPTSIDTPVNERAVCPWFFNKTIDTNRVPKVINEAVCSCKGCFNGGTCVLSYASVPVLRKIPGGTQMETIKVAVACNCMLGAS